MVKKNVKDLGESDMENWVEREQKNCSVWNCNGEYKILSTCQKQIELYIQNEDTTLMYAIWKKIT